jgi:hypothetical protein
MGTTKEQPEASFLFTAYFSSVRHLLSMHKYFIEFSLPLHGEWVFLFTEREGDTNIQFPVDNARTGELMRNDRFCFFSVCIAFSLVLRHTLLVQSE